MAEGSGDAVVMVRPWTTSVKLWGTGPPMPLSAVNWIEKLPSSVGVPESPSPENVTPVGSAPDSLIVGAGHPLAVGLNIPGEFREKVVASAEVKTGAASTVRVKDWLASGGIPLVAAMVSE